MKICTTTTLILFLTSIVSSGYSQMKDSLVLEIKGLKKPGIILKRVGNDPAILKEDPTTIKQPSGSWPLVIRYAEPAPGAYVVVSNTEGDLLDSSRLAASNKSYAIRNDSIVEAGFSIRGAIKIDVFEKAGNTLIKSFPVLFTAQPRMGIAGTRSSSNPSPDDDHQVGSPVLDALYLMKESVSIARKAQVLKYYAYDTLELSKAYSGNPFLDSLAIAVARASQQGKLGVSSIFSSIGGLDVTGFADGAAKFIVKRAKQELSIAFFEKFKKAIRETPDIGVVFPRTASLLDGLDEQVYEYEKYIQNLREAFKKDIVDIHRNLPGIIDNHTQFFSRHQEVKSALLSACYTAQELENQTHPGDMLANYPIEYLDSIGNKNYKGSIQTIQLLSASLRNSDADENASYWVSLKQLRELVNSKEALKIYLGLLLQQAKIRYEGIPYEGTTLVELLSEIGKRYDAGFSIYNSYRSYVLRFGEKVDALNKMIKENDEKDMTDSSDAEKYARYIRTSVDLLEYSTEVFQLPGIRQLDVHKQFTMQLNKYFDVAYASADLIVDISRKNYSSAINSAVRIYHIVTVKTSGEATVLTANAAIVPAALASNGIDYLEFKKTLDRLIRYGSFMATIATARNSDEVEKAIESAALPAGSSRVKRVSDFNVSVNAYAGLFYGIERIKGVDSGKSKFNVYGVTAPIGVAASWGHRALFFPTGKHEWSTSLFVSLIDIGAVAAFRFTDDSTAQIPTIRLKNIFSPGAFLSIGIPKTPLSFNLGTQVGPNLRKVNTDLTKGNDFSDKMYWRFSASLCIDIPVLNFYSSSK